MSMEKLPFITCVSSPASLFFLLALEGNCPEDFPVMAEKRKTK